MRIQILPLLAATALAGGLATPALAQSRGDEARFQAAQQRFDHELQVFRQEFDRYQSARSSGPANYRDQRDNRYDGPPPPPNNVVTYAPDDRYENGYDPARDYRPGTQERVLSTSDRVYAGNDGRYYCRRSDGTTGLIVGGAAGGILGNVIDGGHSRIVGTLLGGAVGAIAGKAIDQNNSQVRCR